MYTNDDLVFSYTRAQALADGVLVAVPEDIQKEAGFRIPVAMSSRVYEDCVAWTVEDSERKQVSQDQEARLWDLLTMARFAAQCEPSRSIVAFDLLRVPKQGRGIMARRLRLVMTIHQGDNGEPCMTIMFPDED
jgi:hypothetical protein